MLHAIRDCRSAGISVKMITGDHAATAQAVARQLALDDHTGMLTGEAIDALDDETLKNVVRETTVFARTSPAHEEVASTGGGCIHCHCLTGKPPVSTGPGRFPISQGPSSGRALLIAGEGTTHQMLKMRPGSSVGRAAD